jgi:hypothetical protein
MLADNIGDGNIPGTEVPSQDVNEKLKDLLETDEPQWYKYYESLNANLRLVLLTRGSKQLSPT